MSKAVCASSRSREVPIGAGHLISRAFLTLERALVVRKERRMLLELNEHALKDFGMGRGEAFAEGSRSIWDLPSDRA